MLRAHRDAGRAAPPRPEDAQLLETLRFLTGDRMDAYLPLLVDELMLAGDPGAPSWRKDDVARDRRFEVLVIGAGMSGLLAGHRLDQAGVPFTIVEKNDDVGGTWLENRYPGCRVDLSNPSTATPSPRRSTGRSTSPPSRSCSTTSARSPTTPASATASGSGPRCERPPGTRPSGAGPSASASPSRPPGPTGDGAATREETVHVDAVISAVGQLNRPSFPAIEGAAREVAGEPGTADGGAFAGPWFHSARWDGSVDLTGKRVAVIGTGATAFRFIPMIADQVADMVVLQRTAPWMAPSENCHWDVGPGLEWLFRPVPHDAAWYRFRLFTSSVEGMLLASEVDDDWDGSERSVGRANERLRELLTAHILGQHEDDPELGRQVLPDHPPAAKRMLKDNGEWAATLKRGHVHLVTTPIEAITERGVRLGRRHTKAVDPDDFEVLEPAEPAGTGR